MNAVTTRLTRMLTWTESWSKSQQCCETASWGRFRYLETVRDSQRTMRRRLRAKKGCRVPFVLQFRSYTLGTIVVYGAPGLSPLATAGHNQETVRVQLIANHRFLMTTRIMLDKTARTSTRLFPVHARHMVACGRCARSRYKHGF